MKIIKKYSDEHIRKFKTILARLVMLRARKAIDTIHNSIKDAEKTLQKADAESVKINAINYSSSEDKFVLIIEVTYDGETRIVRIAPDHI